MKHAIRNTAFLAAALLLSGLAVAQSDHSGHAGMPGMADMTAADTTELSEGEVRKIDKDAGKLTLRHGPLKNLDMPGMTMVFPVKDTAALEPLTTGEKVRFLAERIDGKIVVTRIEPAH